MDIEKKEIQSEFVHDLKIQKEFLRCSVLTNRITGFSGILVILVLLWFFHKMLFVLEAPDVFSWSMLFLTALYLLFSGIQALVNRGGGISYKRNLVANNGKPVHSLVQFSEDAIVTVNLGNDNRATFSYDQVKSIRETENLFLCSMAYQLFLIVDKRTLTCSREEFLQMLFARCSKVRQKRVRSHKPALILERVKWVVIAVLCVIAVYLNPVLQISQRLHGQIHNGMTVAQIAQELAPLDIRLGDGETLEQLEHMYGSAFFRSGSKLESILYHVGLGEHDFDASTWTPSDSGVYYCSYWAYDCSTMYTDLLRGISALDPDNLRFEEVQEDHSQADWENYSGHITLSFSFSGKMHSLDAVFYEEWYDETILNALNAIITEETGRSLYFCDYQDMGCFVFYGTPDWAELFAARTGLEPVTDILEIY